MRVIYIVFSMRCNEMDHKNCIQKYIHVWILICSLVFAAGCGGKSGSIEQTDHDNRFWYQSSVAAGEDGYYFSFKDEKLVYGGFVYFFDAGSGQYVKLCGKADCTHGTEECNAYVNGMISNFIACVSNKIYYLQQIDLNRISLCSMEKDGTNHREITTVYEIVGNDFYYPSGFIHRNYFYYITHETGGKETLYRVKIEEDAKPEKYLETEFHAGFTDFLVQGDDLYFVQYQAGDMQNSGGKIIHMSIETKEKEVLYEYDEKQVISGMTLADGYLYYSIGTEGVRKRNLETGEEEWFGTDLPEYANIYTDGIYIYVDNMSACDIAYFDEEDEDAFKQREILILDKEGAFVDVVSLSGNRGACMGGDEKFLFCQGYVDGAMVLLYYDKSQIGSGNAVIGYAGGE